MTPAELAALRARFPELQGMGGAISPGYLTDRFAPGGTAVQMTGPSEQPAKASDVAQTAAALMERARQLAAAGDMEEAKKTAALAVSTRRKELAVTEGSAQPAQKPAAVSLADLRAHYPQYNSMSDTEFADRLYRRFYEGKIARAEFDARLGLSPSTATPDPSKAIAERIAAAKAGTLTVSPESASRANAADAIASETMNVPAQDLDARRAALKAKAVKVLEGLERSGEITPQEQAALDKYRSQTTPGMVGGVSGAMTDGALFGFGDEYLAGLSAVLGVQPDGQGGANWFDYSKPLGDRYSTALDALRMEQSAFREAEPAAALGGEIVGSLLGPVKGGGAFVNAGRGTAARVGRGLLVGAGAGGLYGFGEGEGGAVARVTSGLLAAPVAAVGGAALVGAGQGISRAVDAVSKRPALREAIPTLEGLREAASGLYAKAREMGGELSEGQVSALTTGISARINEAGFDRQLHPRVAAVVDRLNSETGPKSLQEMEILRRVASNAAASLQPDERRIAMEVVDAIDDAVDGMGGGSKALAEARDTWSRLRRMELIDEAMSKAALTDDFAAGLRSQFKTLLRNPRRLRGFSEAQIAAIRAVAKGGPLANSLRGLGKLLSPNGISGAAITGGAAFAGAGFGSLAIPLAGAGMSKVAGLLTAGAANKARSMAGMSEAQRGILANILERQNPAAGAIYAPGLLGAQLTQQ